SATVPANSQTMQLDYAATARFPDGAGPPTSALRDLLHRGHRHIAASTASSVFSAAGLWAIIIGVIAVKSALQPGRHSVFYVFVNGGRHWLQAVDMYGTLDLDCFRYSPLVGILMIPFTL